MYGNQWVDWDLSGACLLPLLGRAVICVHFEGF